MSESAYFGTAKHLPMLHCPNCGGKIDGATPVSTCPEDPTPKPGHMTICYLCACWLIFEASIASTTPVRLRIATCREREILFQTNPLAEHLEKATRSFVGRPQRG